MNIMYIRQLGVNRVMTSRIPGGVMVNTQTQNVIGVPSNTTLSAIFLIVIPNTEIRKSPGYFAPEVILLNQQVIVVTKPYS